MSLSAFFFFFDLIVFPENGTQNIIDKFLWKTTSLINYIMARDQPGFCHVKKLGVILLLPTGWDACRSQGKALQYVASTHLFTPGWRETM